MSDEVVVEGAVAVPQGFSLAVGRDPMAVLAEAKRAAKALTDVIRAIPEDKKVMMGGEQYIEFDGWQLVARFYGCSVKVVGTETIEFGDARGFLAKAVVLDAKGSEISAAEAMCLNDEEKWSTRSKYEWKDSVKTKVGDVPVPAFQLRSMAQTRACGKALRNVFSWVVVLAGYAATPAEEMTGDEHQGNGKPPVQQPKPKEAGAPQATQTAVLGVAKVSSRTVKGKNGPIEILEVVMSDGRTYETRDKEAYRTAEALAGTATKVEIAFTSKEWAAGRFNYGIVGLKVQEQGAEA